VRLSITNRELGLEVVRLRKESRETANQLRRRVRAAAAPLKNAVIDSALEAGMHKAAGAVSVRQSYTARGAAIKVIVDAKKAPNARPLDSGNKAAGTINRHPVYGDREVWVDQPARPFFKRGIARGSEAASREVEKVLDDIVRAL
jgi:hypothetical protein